MSVFFLFLAFFSFSKDQRQSNFNFMKDEFIYAGLTPQNNYLGNYDTPSHEEELVKKNRILEKTYVEKAFHEWLQLMSFYKHFNLFRLDLINLEQYELLWRIGINSLKLLETTEIFFFDLLSYYRNIVIKHPGILNRENDPDFRKKLDENLIKALEEMKKLILEIDKENFFNDNFF